MEYPLITLGDGVQISHSDAFHRAVLVLPAQEWREVTGFTADEFATFKRVILKMPR